MDTYHFRKQIHRLPGKVIHAIPLPEPEVIAGQGARREIGAMCRKAGYRQVLVVTDQTLHHLGYDEAILESLKAAGVEASLFCDIHSEPNTAIIEAGRMQALRTQAEAIIALGGGSVMDSCKMIAAGCKMPHVPVKALLLKFLHRYFAYYPDAYFRAEDYYPKAYIDEKYDSGAWEDWF